MLRGIKEPEYPKSLRVIDAHGNNVELYTVIIDSCEYISSYYLYGDASKLAHKGNCKFCRQREEDSYRRIISEELEKIKK